MSNYYEQNIRTLGIIVVGHAPFKARLDIVYLGPDPLSSHPQKVPLSILHSLHTHSLFSSFLGLEKEGEGKNLLAQLIVLVLVGRWEKDDDDGGKLTILVQYYAFFAQNVRKHFQLPPSLRFADLNACSIVYYEMFEAVAF